MFPLPLGEGSGEGKLNTTRNLVEPVHRPATHLPPHKNGPRNLNLDSTQLVNS